MSTLTYTDGILREAWNDTTRTYTEYDEEGAQTLTRPYDADENTAADTATAQEQAQADTDGRAVQARAILAAVTAIAVAPADGATWAQPLGTLDAYTLGSTVTHKSKTWVSLTPFNVWEPGVASWREQAAEGYPAWMQPTGAQDAYNIGDRVTFDSKAYESVIAANTWSPTAYPAGWTHPT